MSKKKFIEVSFDDEGIGISHDDQSKLFKLFGQVDESRESLNPQGVGLGLFITKAIV